MKDFEITIKDVLNSTNKDWKLKFTINTGDLNVIRGLISSEKFEQMKPTEFLKYVIDCLSLNSKY